MKWTVAVNHYEYCRGIFSTEQAAEEYAVKQIRADEPAIEELSDEDVLEYSDGYYSVMKISEEL